MIKSVKYTTSKSSNIGKLSILSDIFKNVRLTKNQISNYIFTHRDKLLGPVKDINSDYKFIKSDYLSAWEIQTLFHYTLDFYLNQLDQLKSSSEVFVQSGFISEYYKQDTKYYRKGEVKYFKLQTRQTVLTKLIKYGLFIYFSNYQEYKEFFSKCKIDSLRDTFTTLSEIKKLRVFNLIISKQHTILSQIKLITYKNGTHFKALSEGGKKLDTHLLKDNENIKFKYFTKYKLPKSLKKLLERKDDIYLPIQISSSYHPTELVKSQVIVKEELHNKVSFIMTTEKRITFKQQGEILGVDVNMKHNLLSCSNGFSIDYNREYIQEFTSELQKLDGVGLRNISEKSKSKLNKLIGKNEWYFKKLISEFLDYCEKNNITDIVMEDLDLSKSPSFGVKNDEFGVKWSRLIRLLRLSNIKGWMKLQSNNRGIRVHLVTAYYTSQECSECGHIDKESRKTQEYFCCTKCGFSENADYNASKNIRKRYTSDVLRSLFLKEVDNLQFISRTFLKKEYVLSELCKLQV